MLEMRNRSASASIVVVSGADGMPSIVRGEDADAVLSHIRVSIILPTSQRSDVRFNRNQ